MGKRVRRPARVHAGTYFLKIPGRLDFHEIAYRAWRNEGAVNGLNDQWYTPTEACNAPASSRSLRHWLAPISTLEFGYPWHRLIDQLEQLNASYAE